MVAVIEHEQTLPPYPRRPQVELKDDLSTKLISQTKRVRRAIEARTRTAIRNAIELRAAIPARRSPNMPLLSIVVAAYNTEKYVAAALRSLQHQQWPEIEVIIVDDGSTDSTAEVISRFTARDSRFHLIQQANAGLGAARNTGAAQATGRYLAFFDSDDIINPFFYRKAISGLELSQSDFAVGSFELLTGRGRRRPAWYIQESHQQTLHNVTLSDIPLITMTVPIWTRVFRRDFYDRKVGPQPEGVLYEDQLPAMKAYVRAKSFDVLQQAAAQWRRRATQDSITQRIAEVENLQGRVQAYRTVADFLEESHLPDINAERLTQILESDQLTLGQVINASPEYFDVAREFLNWAIAEISPDNYTRRVDMQDKVLHTLIMHTDIETTKSFLVAGGRNLKKWKLARSEDGVPLGYLPGWPEDLMAGIPLASRRLSLRQRRMKRL